MAKNQKMVFCRNCNSPIAKGAKICPACGAKNKKPFYKKWWFVLIVVIAVFSFLLSITGNGEKIEWENLELGYMLPEPNAKRGEINANDDDRLSVEINKMSEEDYRDYLSACEEMGYTVEAELNGGYYDAFNEEGYALSLWYYDTQERLHIDLDAPEEMGALTWPNNDLAKLLPVPNSTVGRIERESSDGFYILVGETSMDEFGTYANTCNEAGFKVDYDKGEGYYRAYDAAGNYIDLDYIGNNVMAIEMRQAEEPVEETVEETEEVEETVEEEPENDSASADGIRPEFKDAMDAYEDFIDEYCDFMETYNESDGTDLTLLGKYTNYLTKYADAVEAFEKWDSEDLTDEELKYYVDVQTRVSKKMIDVAQ